MNAALALTQHEVFRARTPVELYLVHVPPDRDRRLTALNSIKQEILGRLEDDSDEEARAEAFFDAELRINKPQTFDGSVHTECAVLGILADGGSQSSPPAVHALFEFRGQPLGNLAQIFQVRCVIPPTLISCY